MVAPADAVGPCSVEGRHMTRAILLLTADTGGGHRAAAEALRQELERRYGGRLTAVTCDPLTGAHANRFVRWVCLRYGPLVRTAPWLWSVLFHATNNPVTVALVRRLLARFASAPIAEALARHRPPAIIALHPLLTAPTVAAAGRCSTRPALVTVVTDLGTVHRSWLHPAFSYTVTSQIPVREQFQCVPADPATRAALRVALGLGPDRFVVLVVAGAEGGRGVRRWTRAILSGTADIDVVAVCGRDERLRTSLLSLAAGSRGRLVVTGFVENMADWMRSADVLVTKAGPGTIAEAASCGVPMLLAGHLPGQERGNTEIVVRAGAGRPVRGRRQLRTQLEDLRSSPSTVDRMRAAALRLGRPAASTEIADLVARAAGVPAEEPVSIDA
jgi:1,2-diacylglycerol 3-beta-galactosyltransferase